MSSAKSKHLVIIGAGYSGTLTAVQLTKLCNGQPLEITLVDQTGRFGLGLAYGTHAPVHLLNVPAGRMSAFPDKPDDFLNWLNVNHGKWTGDQFAPRKLYGAYINSLFENTSKNLPSFLKLNCLKAEARQLARLASSSQFEITFVDSPPLVADRVVLALGNVAPDSFPGSKETEMHPAYVANPWHPLALSGVTELKNIVLLGTGLTAVDLIVEAEARGFKGEFLALSRRGLLPRNHNLKAPLLRTAQQLSAEYQNISKSPTARSFLALMKAQARRIEEEGGTWREAVDAVRSKTPELWACLSISEQQRFMRHVRPYWEVHRHRTPPEVGDLLQRLIAIGRLKIFAGRVAQFKSCGSEIAVTFHHRYTQKVGTVTSARVINCTGPDLDPRRSPVLKSLLDQNLAAIDDLGLGLKTDNHGRLIGSNGATSPGLYTLGNLRRGELWESTAVPELRVQALALAKTLSGVSL